jgi:glucan endo-1,3-alpha-glucosidase
MNLIQSDIGWRRVDAVSGYFESVSIRNKCYSALVPDLTKLTVIRGCNVRLLERLVLFQSMALVQAGMLLLWLGWVLFSPSGAIGQTNSATSPHYVFAHYMVCFATYGQSVDGYKREITEAQAAGIDGFVLDIGAWNDPVWTYYNQRVALIYSAAEALGTGFKLSFFIEFSGPTNINNLIQTYARRPNTFWYQGRVVLSSWGMNDVPSLGWVGLDWTNILGGLSSQGYPIFFIPHFWPAYAHELPTYTDAQSLLATNATILNGLFLFGAAGLPSQLAQCNSNYTKAVHVTGKTFMAGITPSYWGDLQPSGGRRYFESGGGEGLDLQWKSIISNQPDWVNLVTWNDFNESTYFSPVDDCGQYFSALTSPHRYSHKGYLELSKHYIAWYKTGKEPSLDADTIFYFYRTHSKTAVAANTNDVPVTSMFGDVQDSIYTTVFLTAPAQLQVSSGGIVTTNALAAGISQVRTPFQPGPQSLTLFRNGQQVISSQGSNVLSQIQVYDFFPSSGFVSTKPPPPVNFRASGI